MIFYPKVFSEYIEIEMFTNGQDPMNFFPFLQKKSRDYPEIIPNADQYTNFLLIDEQVKEYQVFDDSVNDQTFSIIYSMKNSQINRLKRLASYKDQFTSLERIGIVFSSTLVETVNPQCSFLIFITQLVKNLNIKNIDFLACNTLNNPIWVNYYQQLANETGVIVGASNDKTGNIKYGGDWVMESTGQDIETIYFTKSIEYYQYLLDTPAWASGFQGPTSVVVKNNNMYVANFKAAQISELTITNPSSVDYSWVNSGLVQPFSLALSGNDLFVSDFGSSFDQGYISKIDLSSKIITPWVTGLYTPTGIAIAGNNLYVIQYQFPHGTISNIELSSGTIINPSFVSGLTTPVDLAIFGSFMYTCDAIDGTIVQIELATGTIQNSFFVSGLNVPLGIAIDSYGVYMYVANYGDNTIIQIHLSDGSIHNPTFVSGLNEPLGLTIDKNYLYVTSRVDGTIGQYELPLPPVPPVPPVPPAPPLPTNYYTYPSYLQPTSSLGSYQRYGAAASLGPRAQTANANRIYSFYRRQNQQNQFLNQLLFSIYGIKK
jgi:DNA-binding beta-propeller fold protein YncE